MMETMLGLGIAFGIISTGFLFAIIIIHILEKQKPSLPKTRKRAYKIADEIVERIWKGEYPTGSNIACQDFDKRLGIWHVFYNFDNTNGRIINAWFDWHWQAVDQPRIDRMFERIDTPQESL